MQDFLDAMHQSMHQPYCFYYKALVKELSSLCRFNAIAMRFIHHIAEKEENRWLELRLGREFLVPDEQPIKQLLCLCLNQFGLSRYLLGNLDLEFKICRGFMASRVLSYVSRRTCRIWSSARSDEFCYTSSRNVNSSSKTLQYSSVAAATTPQIRADSVNGSINAPAAVHNFEGFVSYMHMM